MSIDSKLDCDEVVATARMGAEARLMERMSEALSWLRRVEGCAEAKELRRITKDAATGIEAGWHWGQVCLIVPADTAPEQFGDFAHRAIIRTTETVRRCQEILASETAVAKVRAAAWERVLAPEPSRS